MTIAKHYIFVPLLIASLSMISCKSEDGKKTMNDIAQNEVWAVDFLDEFDTFNPDNWQDQRIWVNNETHCYVPDGEFGTREVSEGTLKLKVVKINEKEAVIILTNMEINIPIQNMLLEELHQK